MPALEPIWAQTALTYRFEGDLVQGGVLTVDGSTRIEGFRNGDLGITLDGGDIVSANGLTPHVWDWNEDPFLGTDEAELFDVVNFYQGGGDSIGMFSLSGMGGNDVFDTSGLDTRGWTAEEVYIDAGPGDDFIRADTILIDREYPDIIWGGSGRDTIVGGAASQWVTGDIGWLNITSTISGSQQWFEGEGFHFDSDTNALGIHSSPQYALSTSFSNDEGTERIFSGGFYEALRYMLGIPADAPHDPTRDDDTLDGGGGSDGLAGGFGSDIIFGGEGDDALGGDIGALEYRYRQIPDEYTGADLYGGWVGWDGMPTWLQEMLGRPGDDFLDGGSGNDLLMDYSGGSDTLLGGIGNDKLENDEQLLYAESVSNYLDGGDGDDVIESRNPTPDGYDMLIGGAGNDRIHLSMGGGELDGGSGDDVLRAEEGNHLLLGGEGADWLIDAKGENIFDGGAGDDFMAGGAGAAYFFKRGDGRDTIYNVGGPSGASSALYFDRVSASQVSVARNGNDLTFSINDTSDAVTLADYFSGHISASSPSVLQFANNIKPRSTEHQQYSVSQLGDYLTVSYTLTNGDVVDENTLPVYDYFGQRLGGADIRKIDAVHFADGEVWDTATLKDMLGPDWVENEPMENSSPVVAAPIADQVIAEDAIFYLFTIPADAFIDPDVNGGLTYSATLANGDPLPWWLGFDPSTRTFVGAPSIADVNSLSIKVTATDPAGAQVSDEFMLTIQTGNNAPVVALPLADGSATEAIAFSYTIPADAFSDPDQGDALTYSVSLSDGDPLPAWLTFDATTRTFSGAPPNADIGEFRVKVTATDSAGASASDEFKLTVQNINDAPIAASVIPNRSATETIAFTYTIPAEAFSDPDQGDVLSYNATLPDGNPLPSWLVFDATTRTITGIPPQGVVSTLAIRIIAQDSSGATASSDFNLDIGKRFAGGSGNDVITGTANADLIIGGAGSDTLNGGAGDDVFQVTGVDAANVDIFHGGDGFDVIQGGAGDDRIQVNSLTTANSIERIDGGAGTNVLAGGYGFSNDTIDLTGITLVNIAALDGGGGNDAITGTTGSDVIVGGVGADTLNGGDGDDIFQVMGTDTNADVFNGGAGFDTILGGAGADTIRVNSLTAANSIERIDGGAGVNILAGGFAYTNDTLDLSGIEVVNIAAIDGGSGDDLITGTAGADVIIGGIGADTLNGGAGDDIFQVTGSDTNADVFNGGAGFDTILGGAGNDVIRVNTLTAANSIERIDGGAGVNVLAGGYAYTNDTIDLSGVSVVNIAAIDGGNGNDTIIGTAGADIIIGGGGADTLNGADGDDVFQVTGSDNHADVFNGGAGFDTIAGDAGDDWIRVSRLATTDSIERIDGAAGVNVIAGGFGFSNDAIDLTGISIANIAMIDGGYGDDVITGSASADLINGGAGADSLYGALGMDVLQGGDGADVLSDAAGNNLFNGGAGADSLTGGEGNELYIGGAGGDNIAVGGGRDVIAFNRGDGSDTVMANAGLDNTLSLGGGIRYQDLAFSKNGANLVLNAGAGESITFTNWYGASANRNVLNLQVVADAMADFDASSTNPLLNNKVEQFDFNGLVNRFDAVQAANPGVTSWALMDAMLDFHLGGSDTAAIGGDLAYEYGKRGNLAQVGSIGAQNALGNAQFGVAPQAFQTASGLQEGMVKLG